MHVNRKLFKKPPLPPGLEDFINRRKKKRSVLLSFFVTGFFVCGLLLFFRFKALKSTMSPLQETQGVSLYNEANLYGPNKVNAKPMDLKADLSSKVENENKARNEALLPQSDASFRISHVYQRLEREEAPSEEEQPDLHHIWRGRAFEEKGLFEEALEEYKAYLQKKRDHLVANKVASLLIRLNKLKEAKETLEEAIASGASYPGIYVNYGVVLAKLGDLEGAERTLRTALVLFPDHRDLLYNLAVLLELKGDRKEALEIYKKLHGLGDTEALDALRRLNLTS